MAPKDVYTLIPGTCEYDASHGKGKDFAVVTKVMGFTLGRVPWIIQMGPIFLQLEAEGRRKNRRSERCRRGRSQRDLKLEKDLTCHCWL